MDTSDVRKRMMNQAASELAEIHLNFKDLVENRGSMRKVLLFPHVVQRDQPKEGDFVMDAGGVIHKVGKRQELTPIDHEHEPDHGFKERIVIGNKDHLLL